MDIQKIPSVIFYLKTYFVSGVNSQSGCGDFAISIIIMIS